MSEPTEQDIEAWRESVSLTDDEIEAAILWAPDYYGGSWVEDFEEDTFYDAYAGVWGLFDEFAADLASELLDLPDAVWTYFDYDKWARDLALDYNTYPAPDWCVYVFRQV